MNFPQPVWAPDDRPSGTTVLAEALQRASPVLSTSVPPAVVVAQPAGDQPQGDTADNPELELELETMVDGIGSIALQEVADKAGGLEKFIEIDDRNTQRIDNHIASLIGQEATIQRRIERDVRLLLKTRKTRMAQEAASRILHSDDDAVIALLQKDPLNTAEGAVKIAKDGATTEGGTHIPFRTAAAGEGEEDKGQTSESGKGE